MSFNEKWSRLLSVRGAESEIYCLEFKDLGEETGSVCKTGDASVCRGCRCE